MLLLHHWPQLSFAASWHLVFSWRPLGALTSAISHSSGHAHHVGDGEIRSQTQPNLSSHKLASYLAISSSECVSFQYALVSRRCATKTSFVLQVQESDPTGNKGSIQGGLPYGGRWLLHNVGYPSIGGVGYCDHANCFPEATTCIHNNILAGRQLFPGGGRWLCERSRGCEHFSLVFPICIQLISSVSQTLWQAALTLGFHIDSDVQNTLQLKRHLFLSSWCRGNGQILMTQQSCLGTNQICWERGWQVVFWTIGHL